MLNLNRHEIIGHLGGDPVLKETASGRPVANVSMATTATWKDQSGAKQERTDWHRIVVWGARAKLVAQHARRGSYLRVVGPSQTRSYTDREGIKRWVTEIVAESVGFLTSRAAGEQSTAPAAAPPLEDAPAPDNEMGPPAPDTDIPF